MENEEGTMQNTQNYFMRDQARHRVRYFMGKRGLRLELNESSNLYRPVLLVALGVLAALNIMLVMA